MRRFVPGRASGDNRSLRVAPTFQSANAGLKASPTNQTSALAASGNSCRPLWHSREAQIEKGPRAQGQGPPSSSQRLEERAQTAFRVFRPAPPARVETRDGHPVRVAFSGFRAQVISASGPWRFSGDWWSEDSYDKDEWDLEIHTNASTENGKQQVVYRVCYDWTQKAWFVRGAFD